MKKPKWNTLHLIGAVISGLGIASSFFSALGIYTRVPDDMKLVATEIHEMRGEISNIDRRLSRIEGKLEGRQLGFSPSQLK